MSKLRPLLKNDATEAEKWLLRSARLDMPSRSSKRRVLAALGFAAAATTAASTSGVAAAATVSVGWVIKCIVVGAVGGVIVAGAIERVEAIVAESPRTPSHAAASAATQVVQRATMPRAAVRPPIDPPPADQPLPAETAPEVPQAPPVPAATQSLHGAPIASAQVEPAPEQSPYPMATTLAEEVRALDQARRALASGDIEAAEHLLDAYDLHIATPRLRPEAIVLRIETLLAEGRRDRARRLGERFLAEDPEGAYAQHVRSLLADPTR